MKVSGFTSSTGPSARRHFAISASAGADSKPTDSRRASSSTTSKPTLCRVPLYWEPGLPSPTIAFTSELFLLVVLLLGLFLVLLALLQDFGLGDGGGGGVSRRRDFHGLRHDDVHQHQVEI